MPDDRPNPLRTRDMAWSEYREANDVRWRYKYFPDPERCHVGFGIMELPPGCHTGTAHYHMREEEHVYVLEGQMEVRLGDVWHDLGPGDYVWFAAADPVPHKLRNRSAAVCRFLLLGERRGDDVVVYPEVDQIHVRLLGSRHGPAEVPVDTSGDD